MKKDKIVWSDYQKVIFEDIKSGVGHTLVIARAGSSKTSSIVEGSKYVPKDKSVLFCAFNKSIQEELKSKLSSRVDCLTLHSLGFRGIRQRFGNVELNERKCWNIVETFFKEPRKNIDIIESICKTVSFCKNTLTDTPDKIEELICKYDIDICELEIKDFINHVCKALRLNKEKTSEINFDDMIWFPFVYRINVMKYDMVFIDEAHDLTRAQIELAISAVKKSGRIISVLDPNQAIYGWRCADSTVLDNFKERLKPKELSLPICYRCPKCVVKAAQEFVPDIMPYENNIEGEIIDIKTSQLVNLVKPGCFVLSRYNAPLVRWCLIFLKNKIPANIMGRDLGSNLLSLIKKSRKKTITDFLKWLNTWEKNEKEKLLERFPGANTESITDKAECLNHLCEDASSLEDVKDNIDQLFSDKDESTRVTLSSIHRIKGKETDDVFILADTLSSASQEELNIHYVAITRAKKKLYMAWKKKGDF